MKDDAYFALKWLRNLLSLIMSFGNSVTTPCGCFSVPRCLEPPGTLGDVEATGVSEDLRFQAGNGPQSGGL